MSAGKIKLSAGKVSLQSVVLALSAVLVAVALVLAIRAMPAAADENQAWVDPSHDKAVSEVVVRSLTQVLSYDYQQPEATKAMAAQVLDGQARTQYDTLFESLAERAPGQELRLSTMVQAWAMRDLTDTRANLLVFLDQTSTRAGDKEASVTAAQLDITAEKRGKTWVITGLKPL